MLVCPVSAQGQGTASSATTNTSLSHPEAQEQLLHWEEEITCQAARLGLPIHSAVLKQDLENLRQFGSSDVANR